MQMLPSNLPQTSPASEARLVTYQYIRRVKFYYPNDIRIVEFELPSVEKLLITEREKWFAGELADFFEANGRPLRMEHEETIVELGKAREGVRFHHDENCFIWITPSDANTPTGKSAFTKSLIEPRTPLLL